MMGSDSRKAYYLLSVVVGLAYFSVYFILRALFKTQGWFPIFEMSYLVLDGLFVVLFFIKDSMDEKKIRQKSPPVGPHWFEHAPFAFIVALHAVIAGFIETNGATAIIYFSFAILLCIDAIWDSLQDVRSKSYR